MTPYNKSVLTLLSLVGAITAYGQTSLLPTADTMLDQQGEFYDPPTFFGASPDFSVGSYSLGEGTRRRSLIRFDLSSLSGQTVSSASLTLVRDGSGGTFTNQTVSLFATSSPNGGWTESTAAWAWQSYRATHWAGSDGLGTAGTDYLNGVLATATVNSTDSFGPRVTFTLNSAGITALQSWIDSPSSNAGFLLRADGLEAAGLGIAQFRSRESLVTADWPVLEVSTIPEPSSFAFIAGILLSAACHFRCGQHQPIKPHHEAHAT